MRDILFFAFLVALAPVAIALPYVGLLVWSWLSFQAINRETFSAAYEFHSVVWFAVATLAVWAFTSTPKLVLRERTTIVLILFVVWTAVTTAAAIDVAWSYPSFVLVAKTAVLAVAALSILNSRSRIQAMMWVIAVSLGYYAVKGFGFTLMTGGQFHVLGPADSAIGDNNTLGAAFVLTLPLLNYLRVSSRNVGVSIITGLVMIATVVSVIGTYSRGGLFGLVVVGVVLWIRSRHKIFLTALAAATLIALPSIAPQQWYDRMASIQTYAEDASFEARADAWATTLRLAVDRPLTGGGYKAIENKNIYARYTPAAREGRAAHSIYFQVLGDHGFVGLALYALLMIMGFWNLSEAISVAKTRASLWWIRDLAEMMQVAFIGILSAGALLSMAYYDVLIVLIALSARLRLFAYENLSPSANPLTPSWRQPAAAAAWATRTGGRAVRWIRNRKPTSAG